jgi:hypothetical protein
MWPVSGRPGVSSTARRRQLVPSCEPRGARRSDRGGRPKSRLPARDPSLADRGDGLQPDPGHPTADTGVCADRLADGARGLDRREVLRVDRPLEPPIDLDWLLTNITLYWVTGAINSSFWPYHAVRHEPWPVPLTPSNPPTAYASFPREIRHPPRSFAEQVFNIQRWTRMPRGGHFAAPEAPDLLAGDVTTFFRLAAGPLSAIWLRAGSPQSGCCFAPDAVVHVEAQETTAADEVQARRSDPL